MTSLRQRTIQYYVIRNRLSEPDLLSELPHYWTKKTKLVHIQRTILQDMLHRCIDMMRNRGNNGKMCIVCHPVQREAVYDAMKAMQIVGVAKLKENGGVAFNELWVG